MNFQLTKNLRKKITAGALTGTMMLQLITPMIASASVLDAVSDNQPSPLISTASNANERSNAPLATNSVATASIALELYREIDEDAPAPFMTIVDQPAAAPLYLTRTNGTLSIRQDSTAGGYNSTAGSQDTASLILYEEPLEDDFTLEATVSISQFKKSSTGFGLYMGAFSGSECMDEFAALGFRGNSNIRLYGVKGEGSYGALGSDISISTNKEYRVVFSREGSFFFVTVADQDSILLNRSTGSFFTEHALAQGEPLFPGFSLIGVTAEISDIKLTSGEDVLLDSAAWTGSYTAERCSWDDVSDPALQTFTLSSDKTSIVVPWTMEIGTHGADYLEGYLLNEDNEILETLTTINVSSSGTFSFTPVSSGNFNIQVKAFRYDETAAKESNVISVSNFLLPLKTPEVRAMTESSGSLKVIWPEVAEAESYTISYRLIDDPDMQTAAGTPEYDSVSNEYSLILTGLLVGSTYYIEVLAATAGRPDSAPGNCEAMVRESQERDWQFAWFGTSTNDNNNTVSGNIYDGLVLESSAGKGKFTGDGYDGIAYYYTKIDPTAENFVLKATFTVDDLVISNGQEGFALLVRDAVGEHGRNDLAYYSNSVAAIATKVDYNNADGEKVTLRLGLGSRVVKGIDSLLSAPGAGTFSNTMTTLDNRIQTAGENSLIREGESYTLTLKKTNTGYHMIYENEFGEETEDIFYEPEEMTRIDPDFIYVGFAAARNCIVSISDISFTATDPADDPPGEERPMQYVTPSYNIESPAATGSQTYTLVYSGNADARLTITGSDGQAVVSDLTVAAGEKVSRDVVLQPGANNFNVTVTPDPNYRPDEYSMLSNYDPVSFTATVTCQAYGTSGQTIVVAPDGSAAGTGSYQQPLDIKTALSFVQPGQTILMKTGVYEIADGLKIPRGTDGTGDKLIYLVSDPDSDERAVIDFMGTGTGFEIWGNYWYLRGFDVKNSGNMSKGIQLCGSYNTLDLLETYDNGNTGIQISGLAAETIADWPSHNLILNCTSYNNSDAGMEDADGFAAKLTCGYGNVFKGCIAYNNADDGWDLFAKVATGPIGSIVIEDCVTYRNGYLSDGTVAGNGNGFKMGGSALAGAHELHNSISFENKAKGIDSNSCPDIKVYNSTSFNNESYNVALYSNSGVTTNFAADGILSYKTAGGASEQLQLNGQSSLYSDTNYFFDGNSSYNQSNITVTDDWFVSLDTAILPFRNADGSIDMQGLLELTGLAAADSGARLTPIASPEIEIPAAIDDNNTGSVTDPDPNPTPDPEAEEPGVTNSGGNGSRGKYSTNSQSGKTITYPASSGDQCVWHKDTNGWYLLDPAGSYPKSEWKQVHGVWYFFNAQGYMVSGWHQLDQNQWFFMNEDGKMMTGWILYQDNWYYLNPNGAMNTGTLTDNGITYYFNSNGACTNPY